ncbi:MAG: hypothetical protein ABIK65_08810 [Candidatus Eisenbacteria bacterium]
MRRLISVLLLLFVNVLAGQAEEWYFEMDLDGTPGNGPDTIEASTGDYIVGRVWIHGPCPILAVGAGFCSPGDVLLYQVGMEEYLVPESWTTEEIVISGDCVTAQATDFTWGSPLTLPAPLVDLVWRVAADEAIGDLVCDNGAFLSICMETPLFDHCDGAAVRVGGTATEETGWGAIKTLFR